jgi:predicted membrane protein
MRTPEQISLKDQMRNILEEARMVLPGIQALFGFQTIAVFNQRFEDLEAVTRNLHLAALALVVVSIGLVMAPAAWHRIVSPDCVTVGLVRYSSRCICGALLPLALALAFDVGVVVQLVTDTFAASLGCGTVTLLLLLLFWFGAPFRARARKKPTTR